MGEIFQLGKGMRETDYYSLNLTTIKNLIIAPCLEEFIYRVCLINMVIESGLMTPKSAVYIMPLFFAVSHLHHSILDYFQKDTPFIRGMAIALFKLSYTEIFGIYSGLVYVRTGSIWPPIILHAYCNYFGFPNFGVLKDHSKLILRRIIIGFMYIVGVLLFFIFKNDLIY